MFLFVFLEGKLGGSLIIPFSKLGGETSNIFHVQPYFGEMIQFDEHIFQMGWFNHQLDDVFCLLKLGGSSQDLDMWLVTMVIVSYP